MKIYRFGNDYAAQREQKNYVKPEVKAEPIMENDAEDKVPSGGTGEMGGTAETEVVGMAGQTDEGQEVLEKEAKKKRSKKETGKEEEGKEENLPVQEEV